jgi:hypothetical protein
MQRLFARIPTCDSGRRDWAFRRLGRQNTKDVFTVCLRMSFESVKQTRKLLCILADHPTGTCKFGPNGNL